MDQVLFAKNKNCGSLSDTMKSGIPCVAYRARRTAIVL